MYQHSWQKVWTSIKFKHTQPLLCHARVIKDFYLRVLSRLSVKNRIARSLACAAVMKFTRVYIAARLFVHSTRNSSCQGIICHIIYTRHCSVNCTVFICRFRHIYFFKKWFALSGSDIKNREKLMKWFHTSPPLTWIPHHRKSNSR